MRFTLLLAAPLLVVVGCDPDEPNRTPGVGTADRPGESALREIARRNAEAQSMVERFGVEQVEDPFAPSARGGGPPAAAEEYEWPHQARAQLADARCRALSQCANVDVELCVQRESERLAGWPGEGCRPINTRLCIESVRAGGCGNVNWPLPESCSANAVCEEASDVAQ